MRQMLVLLVVLVFSSNAFASGSGDLTVGGNLTVGTGSTLTVGTNGTLKLLTGASIVWPDGTSQNTVGPFPKETNGSVTLPNGLIIKWGTSTAINFPPNNTATLSVNFYPTATAPNTSFPNGILSATISGNTFPITWTITSKDRNGITALGANSFPLIPNASYSYIAIGY